MKIGNEQLLALQQTEALRKPQPAGEGFDALLAEQLGNQGVASSSVDMHAALSQGVRAAPLATVEQGAELSALAAAQGMLGEASEKMEGMFAGFETYAGHLTSANPAGLRAAYSQLEKTAGDIAAFRAAFPDMETRHPELASMVNELDLLATTEKFKFNRGDYL